MKEPVPFVCITYAKHTKQTKFTVTLRHHCFYTSFNSQLSFKFPYMYVCKYVYVYVVYDSEGEEKGQGACVYVTNM